MRRCLQVGAGFRGRAAAGAVTGRRFTQPARPARQRAPQALLLARTPAAGVPWPAEAALAAAAARCLGATERPPPAAAGTGAPPPAAPRRCLSALPDASAHVPPHAAAAGLAASAAAAQLAGGASRPPSRTPGGSGGGGAAGGAAAAGKVDDYIAASITGATMLGQLRRLMLRCGPWDTWRPLRPPAPDHPLPHPHARPWPAPL
jgi:hypothetical protein